jgi:hypothetical protein
MRNAPVGLPKIPRIGERHSVRCRPDGKVPPDVTSLQVWEGGSNGLPSRVSSELVLRPMQGIG